MSMITASVWVPRGAAANFPTKYDIDEKELARISKLAKLQLKDAEDDLDHARNPENQEPETDQSSEDEKPSGVILPKSQGYIVKKMIRNISALTLFRDIDNNLEEYDLEHYDSDTANEDGGPMTMLGDAQSLAYHRSNAEDPYITLQDSEDEDEEREELQILSTDNVLVAAKVEDEVAHLEIYVYEDEADNLYVHHDIMLPAIPLCVEWIDLPVGEAALDATTKGSYVAVGTFDPDIEIWDLDTIDRMYPNAILGRGGDDPKTDKSPEKKKKNRKRSKKANDSYHVDAVLSIAANKNHRNLLASSSADKTIKLWDLTTTKCVKSYSYHTDKICSIAWNQKQSTCLLSGSYDHTVVAADVRAPDAVVPRWGVESDVETVTWDPHDANLFYVTTENGVIHYNDIRAAPATPAKSTPIWTLQAHDQSIAAFDVNPVIPGFLATGSTDKEVKLWNVQPSGPSMVTSRNLDIGKVFTTKFSPDPEVAFRLAVAGSKGSMQVWDTSTNAAVRRAFGNRVPLSKENGHERLVGLEEDSSDSEQEGGEANNNEKGWESMDED